MSLDLGTENGRVCRGPIPQVCRKEQEEHAGGSGSFWQNPEC